MENSKDLTLNLSHVTNNRTQIIDIQIFLFLILLHCLTPLNPAMFVCFRLS